MRAVLQRVSQASVRVDGELVGQIGNGWLVLLGVAKGDDERDAERLAAKIVGLRAFSDAEGKMNLAAAEIQGAVLLVSQFTLMADCRKGRRPGFDTGAEPGVADALYTLVGDRIAALGLPVERGVFQAHMEVSLVNDGPVTFLLDSRRQF